MNRKKVLKVLSTVSVSTATILAWFSGFIVMQIVYDSIAASIIFGTVWAIIVFCECRFSYISLKSDGRIEITKDEIKNNAWHLLAAVLIALLVTIPIELQLFAKQIASTGNDLAMQLKALVELFPSYWFPLTTVAIVIVVIFLVPIITKMASED